MKSKFYFLFLTLICFTFILSAQDFGFKFNTMLMEDWVKSSWRNSYRMTNTYNTSGILTKQESEAWDTITNAWSKQSILTNTLNANGTIAESLNQSWDKTQNKWVNFSKYVYTYDGAKNKLTSTMNMDIGAGWMVYSKSTYEYSGNLLTKETGQSLDYLTMQLKNSSLTTHTYNADGTENQSVEQRWSGTPGAWGNYSRSTYSYNASKKVTTTVDEVYQGTTWVNDSKFTITYNADQTFKEMLDQSWSTSKSIWENKWKDVVTNNPNGTVNFVVSQEWNSVSSLWVNDSRTTFTYSTTGIEQSVLPDGNLARVYPNPFSGEISIDNNQFAPTRYQVFSSTGQLVFSSVETGIRAKLNLNSLQSGTYFLQMNSGNFQQTVKVIKIQ